MITLVSSNVIDVKTVMSWFWDAEGVRTLRLNDR
jgi:hypothetical protein